MALCLAHAGGIAQSDSGLRKPIIDIERFDSKLLSAIGKKYQHLERKIILYSDRSVRRFQKSERKLQKELAKKDSLAVAIDVSSSNSKYADVLGKLHGPIPRTNSSLQEYLPGLDSLQTAFSFLEKTGANIPGVSPEKLQQVRAIAVQLQSLQSRLQAAEEIKKLLRQRKELLKAELAKYGLGARLKSISKQAYYYQQQFTAYQQLINDPEKLERKALGLLRTVPAFKDFISKHGFLAQLFPTPGDYGTAGILPGLQTRAGTQAQVGQALSGAGINPQQFMQQQVQQAQAELTRIKDRVNRLGGSTSDLELPDFKPNTQKTKSFWKRLEYGISIQSQKTNSLLPVTSDIAMMLGYKLTDKSTMGIGVGYKLGWGRNISNIHFSSQGMSVRSYLDIKLKGSIWISGGYEYNYQQGFGNVEQLRNLSAWQRSGLIGGTKKYKIGRKDGKLQLLWDFLSYSQVPTTPALKFRIGYTF